ncbi:MAG: GntR family transcriptional regulator [Rhodospirillales bacterium]|nr:GntR family transcriptional regulator [Rhodospirillales bacterium]MBO6786927.1 GntR family transcriptional regulator [Rhodospirillales bacterium]
MPVAAAPSVLGIQPPPSIPERIADALRREIVTAELDPDTAIKQSHIAARFGVSQAPVREALNQLIGEHLVVHHQNRGVRVAPLDASEFEEAARLRIILEADLIATAATNFTADDEVVAQASLEAIGRAADVGDLMAAHDAFHDAIYLPARSPISLDIVRGLRARCSRYLGFMWKHSRKAPLSYDEHRKLLDWVAAGNGDAAASFLKPHIEGSTAAVLAALADHPPSA